MFASEPKVLLIGRKPGDSSLEGRLRKRGCQCRFASSYDEASALLMSQGFQLVLSPTTLRNTTMFGLMKLLDGSDTTLCYWQAVEKGCWWLPAVERGKRCLGTSALRSEEFATALDKIIDGLSSNAEGPRKPQVSAADPLPRPHELLYELMAMRTPQATVHAMDLAAASRKAAG